MRNLLLLFSALIAFGASAQIEQTLKNAAKTKVESQDFNSQRSNKERNMMDNSKKRSAPAQSHPAPPPGSAVPEPADSSARTEEPAATETPVSGAAYTFGQRITYEMDDPSKPEKEKTTMTFYYGENAMMSVVADQDLSMIYNFRSETMTTVDEKAKTATTMSARWLNREVEKAAATDVTITKTGQTKTILGYTCEEYIIQDAKSKAVCWITTGITVDYTKFLQVAGKNSMSKTYTEHFDGEGISMEITTYDKKGQPNSHTIMTEYKEETTVKSLEGYEEMSLQMR